MSSARDALRGELLKSRAPTSKVITFFGQQIELKQLRLGDVLSARDETDRTKALCDMLIKYAYVPGTDESIFEDGDLESLKQLPFGGDFVALAEAIKDLSSVNFLDQKPSSPTTQSGSSSTASATN
jgi:hypothetical protein